MVSTSVPVSASTLAPAILAYEPHSARKPWALGVGPDAVMGGVRCQSVPARIASSVRGVSLHPMTAST